MLHVSVLTEIEIEIDNGISILGSFINVGTQINVSLWENVFREKINKEFWVNTFFFSIPEKYTLLWNARHINKRLWQYLQSDSLSFARQMDKSKDQSLKQDLYFSRISPVISEYKPEWKNEK